MLFIGSLTKVVRLQTWGFNRYLVRVVITGMHACTMLLPIDARRDRYWNPYLVYSRIIWNLVQKWLTIVTWFWGKLSLVTWILSHSSDEKSAHKKRLMQAGHKLWPMCGPFFCGRLFRVVITPFWKHVPCFSLTNYSNQATETIYVITLRVASCLSSILFDHRM